MEPWFSLGELNEAYEGEPEVPPDPLAGKREWARLAPTDVGACYLCGDGTDCLMTFHATAPEDRRTPEKGPWAHRVCVECNRQWQFYTKKP